MHTSRIFEFVNFWAAYILSTIFAKSMYDFRLLHVELAPFKQTHSQLANRFYDVSFLNISYE